jgi:hypothetical protein
MTRPVRAFLIAMAVVVAFVALLAACSDDSPTRVYVFGDSLVDQAKPYLRRDFTKGHGFALRVEALSGTATCDWFENAKRAEREFKPEVVVMSFSGNALGRCMQNADGSALGNDEYVAKYRGDTERILRTFAGVPVYLVGAPVSGSGDDRVWRLYRELAPEHDDVHFVDGGKYLTPKHRYAATMPCLRGEACTGPVVDGVRHNVVRTPTDRAHFCPEDPGFGQPCPVYSSGAYRFARAMYEAVRNGER